jgi:hypothetical protein
MEWANEAALLAGWIGMLFGVVSGAVIGLFFHREDWMGGYGSFRRRLTRLGHIAFFGLGFLNLLYGLTIHTHPIADGAASFAALMLIAGLSTMSLNCFLTAWRKNPFRHFFFIPVGTTSAGILTLLISWNSV